MNPSANVPATRCLVRSEFLHNLEAHRNEYTEAYVFGVSALRNRALGFHALLETGAVFWRLPIHALTTKPFAPVALEDMQLWSCLSSTIHVIQYAHLKEMQVDVRLPGVTARGEYRFTIDFFPDRDLDTSLAEVPDQHKCAHIIALDDGPFCALPNNRVIWLDESFVRPSAAPLGYKTNTHVWACETTGIPAGDGYLYTVGGDEADV
jgi:hypothetical protein